MKLFKNKKLKNLIRRTKKILFWFVVIVAVLLAKLFFWDVPSLRSENPTSTCYMQRYVGRIVHKWVPYARIAPSLSRAVIAAEDSRFYEHDGVDFAEFKNAFKSDVKRGDFSRGGSTIPMQLAKNLYLSPHKNVLRKAFEILLALKIDFDVPKNRILEIYLNMVEWGDGVYGAEAAAGYYFKKTAAELTPAESAFLAAILPSPIKWGKQPLRPYVRSRIGVIAARMGSVSLQGPMPAAEESPVPVKDPARPSPQPRDIPKVIKMPATVVVKQQTITPAPVVSTPKVVELTPVQPPEEAPQKTIFLDE